MTRAWSFEEAVQASSDAHTEQERIEGEVAEAYKAYAQAERLYSVALARKMWELKNQGVAITACERLAKGDEEIAELREARDNAEGLRETAKHAAWRAAADRRDNESLIDWSKRRELAEGYTPGPRPAWSERAVA